MTIRVIAIEDHPLMLKAIVDELAAYQDIKIERSLRTTNQDNPLPPHIRSSF
jgi:hypothetical protein